MTRMIMISVVLLGMIVFFIYRWQNMVAQSQPPLVTRIDVYPDRITYRNGTYASTSTLAIGLKANGVQPELIEFHGCESMAQRQAVIEVVLAEGAPEFDIVLPEGC